MTEKISRRTALSSGAAFTGGLIASSCAKTPPENNSTPAASPAKAELSDVWGEDFLTQWSPGPDSQREVITGSTPVRLSCTSYRLRYERMSDIDAHIKEGSLVEIAVLDGEIVARPICKPAFDLKTLVGRITPENIHVEVDTGASVGREAW